MKFKLNYLFLLLLIITFIFGYFYFFQISPFIEKPLPIYNSNERQNDHDSDIDLKNKIIYFLYNLEAYKLHSNILDNTKPKIYVIITDEINNNLSLEYYNQPNYILETNFYSFYIENNEVINSDDILNDNNYDLGFIIKKDFFNSDINTNTILENIEKGNIKINVISDEKTLILKGYKVLYDKFKKIQEKNNEITGNFVNIRPLKSVKIFNLFFIFLFASFVGLLIEREK
ncbi:MAG: hypothetical protein QXE31_01455 [Candidatus Woesearchaeota archaeon]